MKKMNDEGYVYLFKAKDCPYFKVGYSLKPDKRLKAVEHGCPFKIIEWNRIKGNTRAENKIHKILRANYPEIIKQARGEWYEILSMSVGAIAGIKALICQIMEGWDQMEIKSLKKVYISNEETQEYFTDIGEFKRAIAHLKP